MKNILTAIALTAIFSGCGVKSSGGGARPSAPGSDDQNDQQSDDQTADQDNHDHKDDPKTDVAAFALQAGVRNYAQVNATMSVLTGVSPATANVKTAFDTELSTGLPAGNDAAAFLGSHQVAVTKLAVEYCDAAFENTTIRAALIPTFNFAAAPSAAFTPASKALVVSTLTDKFWGAGLSDRPTSAQMQASLVALLDDLLVGKTLTDVNVTKNVVKGSARPYWRVRRSPCFRGTYPS